MNIPVDVLTIIYDYLKSQEDKLVFLSINKSFSKTPHLFYCDQIVEFEYRNCYPKILEDEYSESNPVFKNYKNVYDNKYNVHSELIIHNYKKFIRQNLMTSFFSLVFDDIESINNLISIPSEITTKSITFQNCKFAQLCTLELKCLSTKLIFQQCKNIKINTPFTSITNLKLISCSNLNFTNAQFKNTIYEKEDSINCIFPKLLIFDKVVTQNNLLNVKCNIYHFKKYKENNISKNNNILFTYDIIQHSKNKTSLELHNDVHNIRANYINLNSVIFPFIDNTVMSTKQVFIYKIEKDNLIIENLIGTSATIRYTDKTKVIIKNCTFDKLTILVKHCVVEIIDSNIKKLHFCGKYVRNKILIINSTIINILDKTHRVFDVDSATKIHNYVYVATVMIRKLPTYFNCITLIIPFTDEDVTRKVIAENINTLRIINHKSVVLCGFPKIIITQKYKSWNIVLEGNSLLPLSGRYKCDLHSSSKYDIWYLII